MTDRILQLNTSKNYVFLCAGLIVLVLFSYVYCVNDAILNVVKREKIEKQVSSLRSKVSDMEFNYMSLKNTVTLDVAYSLGFKDAVNTHFISHSSGKSLSLNNEN